ncbi:CoA transferase [Rhodococcus sp. WS3]|uniref:CaiB/BaiF CoA-transferase family protein n=1 Tax=Rhodococcus sp. WS3 TaxID=2486271 RepID=UPI001143C5F7|nr:CoA transferase [Rhodococcus sp. WS3]ROZ49027.1 CoA transferase [Rhodococcus sp. WS3]
MSAGEHVETSTYLDGIRVLEIGDEQGEYCGRVLAGMGADVVRVEPIGGERTRSYGPFYEDVPDRNRSLYFWHYNLGKRSVELDVDSPDGRADLAALVAAADVVLDSRSVGYLEARGGGYEIWKESNPGLIYVKITPFGSDGPWAGYAGSDLVHLALGGMVMNCGYDPDPLGNYRTPPIAPQMWQSYHITGEMAVMSVLAALNFRLGSGAGQHIDLAVHDAVAKNTETDIPDWVALAKDHYRRTCSHSASAEGGGFTAVSSLARTQDGRWLLPYRSYGWLKGFVDGWPGTLALVQKYGGQVDLEDPEYLDLEYRARPEVAMHITDVVDGLIARLPYDEELWRLAQASGMPWAPIRKPEENTVDEHWISRGTFSTVSHPELDASFTYTSSRWVDSEGGWRTGPRPPLLGEHSAEVLEAWTTRPRTQARRAAVSPKKAVPVDGLSLHGKPFALAGVRVLDLSWMLASAGAGRYLAAHGAEVIKVEHESRWDGMRFTLGLVPDGGRAERDSATGPIPVPNPSNPNRAQGFMEINSGKLGVSLNLKDPLGKELLVKLIQESDVLLEGFSPHTLERMGFGYERLREINPKLIYVQQSGMGQHGTYGGARAYGPTAQAFTGLSDMSGLPEPYPPAGIGYSYLDWFGAYNMANAVLAALYRRDTTGTGCWIDTSQAEAGLYLTGTAILDHSVNGRTWQRFGNRSPYKTAAPHAIFPTAGTDRWIAIGCFDDQQWQILATTLDRTDWLADERFGTLAGRLAHQDELEALVRSATLDQDGYALMDRLQGAGVPAGVCQSAQDRFETDPQLRHLGWTVDLPQSEIGTWPVREVPGTLSASPSHIGGRYLRSGPSYGEDTEEFYARVLDIDSDEIAKLRVDGVL